MKMAWRVLHTVINRPWGSISAAVTLVIASLGQWIFRTLAIHELKHVAYMTNLVRQILNYLIIIIIASPWCELT